MATKKQSSAKQSSSAGKGEAQGTSPVADAAADVAELKGLHKAAKDAADADSELVSETLHVEPDFAALESRVAQADAAHGAAVASVGTTADELREARAALREARGG